MRFLTAGESHGPAIITIVEGVPAGLPITREYIDFQLARRQGGYGRGGRMKIESDKVEILSGVRGGFTLGSPITLKIDNRDWDNWQEVMSSEPTVVAFKRKVTRPRPGHADLVGGIKYRHRDLRNILERSSARETAARVAAGAIARRLLEEVGVYIAGGVTVIGGIEAVWPEKMSIDEVRKILLKSKILCPDLEVEKQMIKKIDCARENGDSLGGIFEIRVYGLPVGLGSHVHWDRKLDSKLAGALMGIQAIKGVEIGLGFKAAYLTGSEVHDEIYHSEKDGFYRLTNRAGGIEGGISNGETLVVKAAMKPIPTLYKPLKSVDLETKQQIEASVERSDVCAVPAACVVGEAVVAQVLVNVLLEKFGNDSLYEIKERLREYMGYVKSF